MLRSLKAKIKEIIPQKWSFLLEHYGFRRYLKNTGWMFIGQAVSLIISFFIGAWLARYLGPGNYGILSYVLAFAGLFAFIADLGVGSIISRELVAYPEARDKLLGTGFRLKLIGGFVAFILAGTFALLLNSNWLIKSLVLLFAFSFVLQSISVISIFFQAKVESKKNVKAVLVATFISSLLKVAVILSGKGVIWIVFVYVLDSAIQGIGLIRAYRHSNLRIKDWRFDKVLSGKILRNSWPLALAAAAGSIYLKIDQVMVGWLMGNQSVGLYAAAVKITEIFYFIPSVICLSLFPAIVNAKKISPVFYQSRLRKFYILMAGISVLIALPIFFLSQFIILTLFGPAYYLSISILRIYIWSSIGLFLGWAINYYLISENMVRTVFIANLVAMITNIVLNIILIPRIGLNGAAIATLISYFIPPLIIFKFVKYWRKIEAR